MGTFLAYNLKLSVCFLLFYLLYKGLLCRNTFHRANRAVLLAAYLFILVVPLIPFTTVHTAEIREQIGVAELEWVWVQALDAGPEMALSQPVIGWAQVAVMVYGLGVACFAVRYLYFLLRIGRRIRSGQKVGLDDGITLVISEKNTTPFSWMRYIVLSKADNAAHRRNILPHEKAHIRHRHSLDLLLADLIAIIQWYNPVIWLMKNELQDVHEYQADETALRSGIDPKTYQLLLIEKAVGSASFHSAANGFNHSKLKKRITMMLQKKNTPWAWLKYASILPLAALAVTLFAQPEVSNRLEEIAAVQVTDLVLVGEPPAEPSAAGQDSVKTDEHVHFAFVKTAAKAKTPAPPADSLQIVNRLKEWEEFFKTTSPEEFKAMVEQVKGAQKTGRISVRTGEGAYAYIHGDTVYAKAHPFPFFRADSTLQQRVSHFLNDTALRQRIKNIRIITDSIRIKADGPYLVLDKDSIYLQLQHYYLNDSTFRQLHQELLNDSTLHLLQLRLRNDSTARPGYGTIQRKQKIIH